MEHLQENLQISKADSWRLFDAISPRYDFLNRLLSWGQDLRWRREIGRYLPQNEELTVLDLATGTADVLITLVEQHNIAQAYGLDRSHKMLEIGRKKIAAKGLTGTIRLQEGDAHAISYAGNMFSAVTMAFGIRNMANPQKVLKECFRVLKMGGRALVLEFSLPPNPVVRFFHLLYLRYVVPFIGYVFSGNTQAYKYLNETIETFPSGDDFLKMMQDAGFKNLQVHPLLFGAASIYQGDKS